MQSLIFTPFARRRLASAFAALLFAVGTARADAPRELVFLNWDEYMDPALIEAFETRHNATVKQVFYETEEDRNRLLLESGGTGYDVAIVSGSQLAPYRDIGWLASLNDKNAPNLSSTFRNFVVGLTS